MPKARILIVEDDRSLADVLDYNLRQDGYQTSVASDGQEGLQQAKLKTPDLIVLDLGLPKMDGLDVTRAIRAHSNVPIIMLTARVDEGDRVVGLELGADDYITKPFSLRELAARVRAVLRRGGPHTEREPERPPVYRGAHLMADFDAVAVAVDGEAVRLTRREFELLQYLVEHRNRVVSRERLLERVWGYDRIVETRSVDVHVGRLRGKLRAAGGQIETVIGLGYRFVE